jgi:hypothetical protein
MVVEEAEALVEELNARFFRNDNNGAGENL